MTATRRVRAVHTVRLRPAHRPRQGRPRHHLGCGDESLEAFENIPAPEIIAREIAEDLTAAPVEFEAVAAALEAAAGGCPARLRRGLHGPPPPVQYAEPPGQRRPVLPRV